MEITRESIGVLTETIKINFSEADYTERVQKTLKDFQRKANVPGFRPGKVPFGQVKRMYGKSVLLDEVNKLISESLEKYLTESKLNLLGHPLPNHEKNDTIDFDTQTSFELCFDIGLAPEIDLQIDKSISVVNYSVQADNDTLEKYIGELQERFANQVDATEIGADSSISFDFTALDEEVNSFENAYSGSASLNLADTAEDLKNQLLGLKVDDIKTINFAKLLADDQKAAQILQVDETDEVAVQSDYQVQIKSITSKVKAEMNEDLFKKVYGEDVTTEEEFRARLLAEANQQFQPTADKVFLEDTIDVLLEKAAIPLPDAFLKRWLIETQKETVSAEDVEKNYDLKYANGTRWEILEGKIILENNLTVTREDIKKKLLNDLITQYFPYLKGKEDELDERMNSFVENMMKNEKEVKRLYDQIMEQKLINFFKDTISTETKSVTINEFIEIMNAKKKYNVHDHDHSHHDHGHDHDHEH
jgi:trigger factor